MKILHVIKSGKINEIPLEGLKFSTRHKESQGVLSHEGWAIMGDFPEKEHRYVMMFTPEEARSFHKLLTEMLPRFETTDIEQFMAEDV